MRRAALAILLAVACGCSAYQQTYDQETERLEAEDQARQAQERAAARERIATSGFAEAFPARSNQTPEGRRSNRRVEVTVR